MRSLRIRPRILSTAQDGVGADDNRCTIGEQRVGMDLAYNAGYGGSAISVFDVTDKAAPVKLSTFVHEELFRANGLATARQGDTHFLLVACGGDEADFRSQVTCLDVTDPTAPEYLSKVVSPEAFGGARKVELLDDRGYVVGQRTAPAGTVGVIDVSNLPAMSVLGFYGALWLDIVHAAVPYKLTIDGQERIWVFVASSGNPSAFGVVDFTDPENPVSVCNSVDNPLSYNGQVLSSQSQFDGGAGVTLVVRNDRYFAIIAVANNDGVVVVELLPTGPSSADMVLHRPNFRDELHSSSPQHIIAIREPGRGLDADWALVAAQNQTPLPGGFDGAVLVYDTSSLPYIRLVGEIRQRSAAWRTCRHLDQPLTPSGTVGANWVLCALKTGNGFAVLESPTVAARYLSNLTLPAGWPAGASNHWDAGSIALTAGSPIDLWPNDANPANPLVQPTVAKRPTFRRLQAAGKPAASFDGVNDHLLTADLNPANYPRPRTVVTVTSFNVVSLNSDMNLGSPRIVTSGVTNAAVQWSVVGRNPQGTFNEIRHVNSDINVSAIAVMPLSIPLVVVLVLEGTEAWLVVGGRAEKRNTVGLHIPQGYSVGAKPDGLSPLHGFIYEIMDFPWAFDVNEVNHAGRYARVAYGCPWADLSA